MISQLFYTNVIMNDIHSLTGLVNNRSSCYVLISKEKASKLNLKQLPISPRIIGGVLKEGKTQVTKITKINLNIGGYYCNAFAYIIPGQFEDLLLGRPFLKDSKAILNESKGTLTFREKNICIKDTRFQEKLDI